MTRDVDEYIALLARKAWEAKPAGVDVDSDSLNSSLFPFQRSMVKWALRQGRAALWADCGLGKTLCQLAWADALRQRAGVRTLILAPLAVAPQTVREGSRFGIDVAYARSQDAARGDIVITNYEMLDRFDASQFGAVVIDECFAAGTMVDTPSGARMIESLRVGDEILNASGVDVVSDVHRREVPFGVKVSIRNKSNIASPNHPFFTQRGWIGARDLRRGDYVLETAAALPLVRSNVRSTVADVAAQSVLRDILLSEMADAAAGCAGSGVHSGSAGQARGVAVETVRSRRQSDPGGEPGANSNTQSDEQRSGAGQVLPPIERDEARSFRAWGQWSWTDRAAILAAGCSWVGLASGIGYITGPKDARLPVELQNRLGELCSHDWHRGGWEHPLLQEESGSEKGRETAFARVDSIEILEQGHPELERLRASDGKLYFYDIGGTRHPSFSVSGSLVHNSSILKSYDGKTRTQIIDTFRETPYRLACTATPAPNDYEELGNHAEFLGIMKRVEMLANFFEHDASDTGEWLLRGHAAKAFWRWICTWAITVRKPSDLDFDDAGFNLPELRIHEHRVAADAALAHRVGMLFVQDARGLSEQRAARKTTIGARVAKCADIVNASDEQWLLFCDLNAEGDALEKAIGGSVQVAGADDREFKEKAALDFIERRTRVLVSKSSIFGFGLNLQNCRNVGFVGLSNSYEQWYQAVRRVYRFGQTRQVNCHLFTSDAEGAVLDNLRRKETDAKRMAEDMIASMLEVQKESVLGRKRDRDEYAPAVRATLPKRRTA